MLMQNRKSKCCNANVKIEFDTKHFEGTMYYVCKSCNLPADIPPSNRHYDFCGRMKKKSSMSCQKCCNYSQTDNHKNKISRALKGKKNALGFKHT